MRRPGAEHYTYLSPSTDATERLRRLFDAANSANVSIYSLDPIPVTELRRLAADPRVSTPAVRDLLDSSAVQSAMEGLKDGLWQAADETGGRAYIGATELGGALTGINDDTGRFYLLNYAPPEPHGDGAFHSIRVEVDRRDVQVRARKGYVDLSPEARQAVALRAALSVPGAVSGLPFAAVAQRRWSSKGDPVVQLVVAPEGDAEEMSAFSPSSAQASHLFHAVALDEEGTVISEVHQEMHALNVGSGASFRPPVYVHEWALEPGRYELRVVLQDGITGEIGATRVDVEVPRPSVDWSTSDLVVMVASGGGPQPLVDSRIVTDETLLTYVEVVGGRNPILAGDIFTADGSRRLAILPDLPMGMDSAGIHRGAHRIRGMPPGDYLLQIIVVDPAVAEERMFRQRVRVLSSSEIR